MSSTRPIAGDRPPRWLDGVAVTASVLCLIHCLVLPVLLVALPVLVTMLAVPESFRTFAFILALPTSVLAMTLGRRRHKLRWPLVVAGIGLTLLGVGTFLIASEAAERVDTSMGAVLLAVAHVGNWRALSHRTPVSRAFPMKVQR